MNATSIIANVGLKAARKEGAVTWCDSSRDAFTDTISRLHLEFGLPLSLLFGTDDRHAHKTFGVHAVLAVDASHEWVVVSMALPESDARYPSLTKTVLSAHWYERYMRDMFGIEPEGHPDLRRLVHHENVPLGTHPLRKDFAWDTKMEHANVEYPMHHVAGEGIYEIPVGPIHAGVIEPGHFKFNVAGERIITLEGKLFFTHKGVEKLLEGKTIAEAQPFVDRVSGDMSASHALAFAQAIESLSDAKVPVRANYLRGVLTELERMTMHIFDMSNMGGNGTGFTVMAAQGFRVRERMMRLSERICGNRFWRGMIVPGGLTRDLGEAEVKDIKETMAGVVVEMNKLIELGRHSDGLRERYDSTGVLSNAAAMAYGGLGLPARASGVNRDVRRDHPYGAYETVPAHVVVLTTGDVYARVKARAEEMNESNRLITQFLDEMKSGPTHVAVNPKSGFGLGTVESWRGEILTMIRLVDGKIDRAVIRDPSFCNWALFGEIGPGNLVPDFPLCNKSLNLSYSGNDM